MILNDEKRLAMLKLFVEEKMTDKALDILLNMISEAGEYELVNSVKIARNFKLYNQFSKGDVRKLVDYFLPKAYAKMLLHLN